MKTESGNAPENFVEHHRCINQRAVIKGFFCLFLGRHEHIAYARRIVHVVALLDRLHVVPYEAVPQGGQIDPEGKKKKKKRNQPLFPKKAHLFGLTKRNTPLDGIITRSEERRVGKGGGFR